MCRFKENPSFSPLINVSGYFYFYMLNEWYIDNSHVGSLIQYWETFILPNKRQGRYVWIFSDILLAVTYDKQLFFSVHIQRDNLFPALTNVPGHFFIRLGKDIISNSIFVRTFDATKQKCIFYIHI